MKQITDIVLEIAVELFFGQIPVQTDLFIPFVELSEVLSHKQKFFSGMSHHIGVACFQVGKFIREISGHLVDHGAF